MRIEIRPSRPEDFAALEPLLGGKHQHRARTLTAVLDGEVLGIGGLVYMRNGQVWASVVMSEKARRYPTAIHRAGRAAMAMIGQSGVRRLFAAAQPDNPAAERWLERLGFRKERGAFIWRRDAVDDR